MRSRFLIGVLFAACGHSEPREPEPLTNVAAAPAPAAADPAWRPLDGPHPAVQAAVSAWGEDDYLAQDGDGGQLEVLARGAAGPVEMMLVRTGGYTITYCALMLQTDRGVFAGPAFACAVTLSDQSLDVSDLAITDEGLRFTTTVQALRMDLAAKALVADGPVHHGLHVLTCDVSGPVPRCSRPPSSGHDYLCNPHGPPDYCPDAEE